MCVVLLIEMKNEKRSKEKRRKEEKKNWNVD